MDDKKPGILTHVDQDGKASMVDTSAKPASRREARAGAVCTMTPATAKAIRENQIKKGDVLNVARLAGICAAKRTSELIPLCHTIPLEKVSVDFHWLNETSLEIEAQAISIGRTGVEMEALVAASTAALTIYDMCKSSDRELTVNQVRVLSKSGGTRGEFVHSAAESDEPKSNEN
ncbi:MAG: cyclic pyranopterin monophosphate synthase MoaC [Planctomycetales bacterium]|nr:cyclic pyranopterin monophosphate synthase MoaC [Planctomycetales bacterium]